MHKHRTKRRTKRRTNKRHIFKNSRKKRKMRGGADCTLTLNPSYSGEEKKR